MRQRERARERWTEKIERERERERERKKEREIECYVTTPQYPGHYNWVLEFLELCTNKLVPSQQAQ